MTDRLTTAADRGLRRRVILLAVLLLVAVGATVLWSASPLRSWLDVPRAVVALRHYGALAGPPVAVSLFAAACVLGVPVTFLTLVTIIAFGPLAGVSYSLAAAAIGGTVSYGIGRLLGREAIDRLAGPRVAALNARLAHRGLLAVALIRLVPVAPFAVVNMAIGVSHVSLRQFVLGSTLGMAPGASAMAVFVDQIVRAFETPGSAGVIMAVLVGLLVGGGMLAATRWIRRREGALEQSAKLSE